MSGRGPVPPSQRIYQISGCFECTYSSIGVGDRHFTSSAALQGGVKSFGHQDRAGNRKVVFAGDQRGTAKVSGSADTLEHGRESDKALDIGVREGVVASLHRRDTGSLQSSREQLDVLLLVVRNVLDVIIVVLVVS